MCVDAIAPTGKEGKRVAHKITIAKDINCPVISVKHVTANRENPMVESSCNMSETGFSKLPMDLLVHSALIRSFFCTDQAVSKFGRAINCLSNNHIAAETSKQASSNTIIIPQTMLCYLC